MPALEPSAVVLVVLAGSLVLFVAETVRYDLVALLVVLALVLTGNLSAEEAFRGFASEPVILIASMYVFGHAFTQLGVAEALGGRLLKVQEGDERGLVARITLLAGLLSAVLSNTGVVATLMPVCNSLARRVRVSVSRVLMPMAFGSLLGGLVTVIATSSNVTINELARRAGVEPFGVFEFAPLGLVAVSAGALFFFGPGRRLLPTSPLDQSLSDRYQVPHFVTEVLVEPSSGLINRAVSDVELFAKHRVTVIGIVRGGGENTVLAPGPYNRIRADDTLMLQGAPDDLVRLSQVLPLKERKSVEADGAPLYSDDVRLVEAVLPAGSPFLGLTLAESQLRSVTGLNVLAVSKHGELQLKRMQEVPLELGDTLLIQGHVADIERAREGRTLVVLDEHMSQDLSGKGRLALFFLAAVLMLAAFTPLSLAALALAGAVGLVLTRAVRIEDAYTAIQWPILILVGGMLALGLAFDRHGLAEQVALWLGGFGGDAYDPRLLVTLLLLVTVGLTQLLNNVSTAAIMTPVALDLARASELGPRPFLMAVVAGSSLAFLTPVAHQVNAMVMSQGSYRYRDYMRVGLPMLGVMLVLLAWLIPIYFPLTPL